MLLSMQPWSSYNGYWQSTAYGSYGDPNYPATAQTYDYNHQTAVSTSNQQASTPPPPGVESKEAAPDNRGSQSTLPGSANSWSYSGASATGPTELSTSYSQPYAYRFNSQRPLLPSSSMFSGYGTPMYVNPNQNTYGWNSQAYYPAYQRNCAAPGVSPQVWGYSSQPVDSGSGTRTLIENVATPTTNAVAPDKVSSTGSVTVPDNTSTVQSLQTPPDSLRSKGTKEQWSEELKDYVQRAFCSIDTKEEKDQMERILKEKLEYVFRNNIKIDWTTENIPTIPSKAIAAFKNFSNISRPNSVNVVRPMQLLGFRGMRATGPARGSHVRLPVGMLSRGGRNVFASAKLGMSTTNSSDRQMHSHSRSRSRSRSHSRSPASVPSTHRSHRPARRASHGRSYSRSRSSDSHRSSASSSGSRSRPARRRRINSRSRSHSGSHRSGFRQMHSALRSHRSPERSPSPHGANRNNRPRRKRGGGVSDELSRAGNDAPARTEDSHCRGRGRGARRGKGGTMINEAPGFNASRLSYRATRFKDHLGQSTLEGSGSIARTTSQLLLNMFDERDELSADFESFQIVGTMQELEKRYLRLTRAPEPSEVRPLHVLKRSLEHVKTKWNSNTEYHWVCEQFKSIRQDLTVQGIEDEFAVAVYEAHADAALEAGDFEEFHQCQSQLLRLYKEGAYTSRLLEFTAYRLLYYMFTLDLLGINTIMAGLRPTHKSNPCIRFALELRSAWSLNNYRRFFRLVCPPKSEEQPPLRCAQVVHWFLDRERREAIKTYFKVFRPSLSLSYIAANLGFPDTELCKDFICQEFSVPADLLKPADKVDCKNIWTAVNQNS